MQVFIFYPEVNDEVKREWNIFSDAWHFFRYEQNLKIPEVMFYEVGQGKAKGETHISPRTIELTRQVKRACGSPLFARSRFSKEELSELVDLALSLKNISSF